MIDDQVKRKKQKDEKIVDYDKLYQVLSNLLNSDDHIKRVSLIGQNQYSLVSVSKFSYSFIEIDERSWAELCKKGLNSNKFEIIITDSKDKKMIACNCGNKRFLLVVCESGGSLNSIQSKTKLACKEIEQLQSYIF